MKDNDTIWIYEDENQIKENKEKNVQIVSHVECIATYKHTHSVIVGLSLKNK